MKTLYGLVSRMKDDKVFPKIIMLQLTTDNCPKQKKTPLPVGKNHESRGMTEKDLSENEREVEKNGKC